VIEGKPRAATVTATTRVLAYAISRDRLQDMISANGDAATHMRRPVRARYAPDSER
jgi:CRP-like cAMP-binding protein